MLAYPHFEPCHADTTGMFSMTLHAFGRYLDLSIMWSAAKDETPEAKDAE